MAVGGIPPALAPSVEEAYRKKCIELKRRMTEVEESNDAYRLRKVRLMRGIRKMRLERAYLLETLGKRMKKNGSSVDGFQNAYDEDSEGSSEGPPTPHEKPLRSKRSHRRPIPSPPPPLEHQFPRAIAPSQAPNHNSTLYTPRPQTFEGVPTTNGHPPYHPHAPTFVAHPLPNSRDAEPLLNNNNRGPPPPQEAFIEFIEHYILQKPEIYPIRNPNNREEVLHYAQAAWEDPELRNRREHYEEAFQRRHRRYMEWVHEQDRERERLREYEPRRRSGDEEIGTEERRDIEIEGPPPASSGSGGGFTSING